MAKVPKAKNKAQPGIRSRAARRAASPSLDVDKSLLSTTRPSESTTFSHSSGGIEKKQKKKKLTRQQRLRIEKGMERAEMNGDKLEKKVAESKGREKKVKSRAAAWEELNGKVAVEGIGRGDALGKERKEGSGAGRIEVADGKKEEDEWEDEDEDEVL